MIANANTNGKKNNEKFKLKLKQNLDEIVQIQELNLEDKLMLNRIAFLVFRKAINNTKFTYNDFYKYC